MSIPSMRMFGLQLSSMRDRILRQAIYLSEKCSGSYGVVIH